MPGSPDLSHPALAELLLQAVAPQLARALDLGSQVVDHTGTHIGHYHHEEVWKHETEEELGRRHPNGGGAGRCGDTVEGTGAAGSALTGAEGAGAGAAICSRCSIRYTRVVSSAKA